MAYTKPPVGPLRFVQPGKLVTVTGQEPKDEGSVGRFYHQTQPYWLDLQQKFICEYMKGPDLGDIRHWIDTEPNLTYPDLPKDNHQASEGCLVLDILVSRKLFDNPDRTDDETR
ncbi:MAG: hypothetical protein Q9218_007228 [Villophora microphyllina]